MVLPDPDGPKVRIAIDEELENFELVPILEAYSDGFQTVVREGLSESDRVMVRRGREIP